MIAMARCLLRRPEVLLLDEPTENLDADQRTRLTKVIREYARDRTCIVVSHDMDFIAAVADRVIVLGGGRVAQEGTHYELLRPAACTRSCTRRRMWSPHSSGRRARTPMNLGTSERLEADRHADGLVMAGRTLHQRRRAARRTLRVTICECGSRTRTVVEAS